MATIRPFRALRPVPEKAEQVSCVPYDIVHESEAREAVRNNPYTFLRVTRAEAEFPEGSHPTSHEIFERARQNLQHLLESGTYFVEDEPDLYVYRLETGTHTQTGIVACCSLDEYESGLIKKHEKTRPDKVKDRTDHLLAVRAQTGLIFLAFRGTDEIHALLNDAVGGEPLYDFKCLLGVRHTFWKIADPQPFVDAFAEIDSLYIADGHHRAESADAARARLRDANAEHSGDEDYNFVMAGIFPAEDCRILAYNRVVADLNGMSEDEFLERLKENFIVSSSSEKQPDRHGDICMYLGGGRWYLLRFAVNYIREPDPIERLDVSILQNFILAPVLGVTDVQTDDRISFVGGRRGTAELERLVDEGHAEVAFSLYPTTMDDLLAVSDAGEIMPPKSTWFEPKLKDGILVHLI
ncbi:MAG: DUF1015 domain-containing protein [Pyrinomonadaceae bacterium]